jgi:hypothetical protein
LVCQGGALSVFPLLSDPKTLLRSGEGVLSFLPGRPKAWVSTAVEKKVDNRQGKTVIIY